MEQALQFILSLSILIVLHELGHFIPAKIFKTRVEKFFLFFDVKFALFKKKIGETTYGIGWLPLGGYVKISGMVDESMDTENLAKEPEPWEFRAKPAWQRLIIITGGVIVNFILAILIYAGVMSYYGEQYLPISQLQYGVVPDSTGMELGIMAGDKIETINGKTIERFGEIPIEVLLADDGGTMQVNRDGKIVDLTISSQLVGKIIAKKSSLVYPRVPYLAGGFTDTSVAALAGMKVEDSLVSLNGKPLFFYDQYLEEVPKFKNDTIEIGAYSDGELVTYTMVVPNGGKVGIRPYDEITRFYQLETHKYTGLSALGAGWRTAGQKLSYYVRQFKVIFNPETKAYKEVGGFLTMAKQFDSAWNWRRFWEFTAFLSLMLGFLNILPIPALDGGHMMFILYEMVTGKTPSTKFLETAQMIGFFILLGLLLFANGNDVLKLFQ
ncbi:MAG: RIP metalloprotease RseP [Schleiferiaceae bacterium]